MPIPKKRHPDRRAPVTDRFFCPCPRGLEPALAAEFDEFGFRDIEETPGGVGFRGGWPECYRANLWSRVASRVLWQVGHARYRDEDDIYRAAFALPWPAWFTVDQTIRVNVSAIASPVRSLEFVTLRVKDAICDKFRSETDARPSVDTGAPDVRIHAFLTRDSVTLYLDTSGEALFKRGSRQTAGEAPLRENLAAGILRLTGWRPDEPLLDPMCGAGTFLVEAAQMALGLAPGAGRRFGFEALKIFDAALWKQTRAAAMAGPRTDVAPALFGSDIDPAAIDASRENLAAAGVERFVQLQCADVASLAPPCGPGVMIANPPYGVRIGDPAELRALYPKLGDNLKRHFAGWRVFLFTGDLELPKHIRLKPSRRTPLFNGPLECRLFEYRMVEGGMRRVKAGEDPPGAEGESAV
ncbi:MAG: THUMP domain-containing protein [Burkholderiales bacterium]